MQGFGFLFAAYSIIFVVMFLYVLFVARRQSTLETELRSLEHRLKDIDQSSKQAVAQAAEEPQ